MHTALIHILILLISSVGIVLVFHRFRLPPLLGYILVGIAIGPHALGLVPDSQQTRHLAEFGIVFLMFSIGLEFSLPQLYAMRHIVFGLGGAQVVLTMAMTLALSMGAGLPWSAGIALGGIVAMSSTAIVSKLLAERFELQSNYGRNTIGVLLFQDLAVVPLLVLLPALSQGSRGLLTPLGIATFKAVILLAVLLVFGQPLMRAWFHQVARHRSTELFMLNVLLITLGLAYVTELMGLSLALGAFLGGMLISETQYRYQVEDDIKPFRDALLGLFFITIGMRLDLKIVVAHLPLELVVLTALVILKALIIFLLVRFVFRGEPGDALRSALMLAQSGEFGFVLLAQPAIFDLIPPHVSQTVLAAMLLSMMLAPFIIHHRESIVRWLYSADWYRRSMELQAAAVRSAALQQHVIICGYGRSGQNMARLLEQEAIPFIALDHDSSRVKTASAAGDEVVFGDASRREVLMAVGLARARALVVSYANTASAIRVLHHVKDMRPDLPVVVRTVDDADLEKLQRAGATEIVPEVLEGSLMLASQALMLLGVPLSRVVRKIRTIREQRYGLLRGFFHGVSDIEQEEENSMQLYPLFLGDSAAAVGKTLAELNLDDLLVQVTAIRRRNIRGVDPAPDTRLMSGDVLVLMGAPENLAAAEIRLLQG